MGDGDKQAWSPGRARRKPLKPLRAGMPGDSGVLVVTRVPSTTIVAHEAAGALGIRHSPRPLRAESFLQDSGAARREAAKSYPKLGVPSLRANGSRECAHRWLAMTRRHRSGTGSIRSANLTIFWRCDHGLLRGACHRARIRATRWLAMTKRIGANAQPGNACLSLESR